MLDKKRIEEAQKNFQKYQEDGWIFTKRKDISQHAHFFLKNAETSLLTAQTLFDISTNKKIPDFESFLWVIVTSYYSMFYAALALLATHNIKTGDKLIHKVVSDTLITQFLTNQRLAKLLENYEENKNTALELVGAEKANELIENFEQERKKRSKIQYELGETAKQNLAKTSLERATKFTAEIRNILREK